MRVLDPSGLVFRLTIITSGQRTPPKRNEKNQKATPLDDRRNTHGRLIRHQIGIKSAFQKYWSRFHPSPDPSPARSALKKEAGSG